MKVYNKCPTIVHDPNTTVDRDSYNINKLVQIPSLTRQTVSLDMGLQFLCNLTVKPSKGIIPHFPY